ncbi:hypothetical protein OIU85_023345 [Salix viminalis]|uniref:Uncharacterized protein n=1 Tax=Salix viminalis TaxID=40686 RepID=A0A9Q0TYG8_SALVM|nr:hypothetical protein OIU85_023345 [Salix viminalis]
MKGKEDEKGKEKVVDKAPEVFETWDTRLEYLPEESLVDVLKILDRAVAGRESSCWEGTTDWEEEKIFAG